LRFPGQYYDSETGLFQNYFRDYDPQVGRYVESDPLLTMSRADLGRVVNAHGKTLGAVPVGPATGANWRLARGYLAFYQPYAYATDSPLAYVDPLGLEPQALCERLNGSWYGACMVCIKAVCQWLGTKIACCAVAKDECWGKASGDSVKEEECAGQYLGCIAEGPGKKPEPPKPPEDF
jgi:hypothetical protein